MLLSQPLLVFFAALLGLSFGSFGSMLLHRLPKGATFGGRSRCPSCGKVLPWYDLFPILSFFLLRRQCRLCHTKISWRYPFLEACSALLFALLATHVFPMSLPALLCLSSTSFLLLLIAFSDLETRSIPDVFLTLAFLGALLFRTLLASTNGGEVLRDGFLGAFVPFAFFGSLWILSAKKWIGSGDILLGVTLGLLLGLSPTLLALFLAYVIGAIIAILLILFRGARIGSQVPFGPFLSSGAFVALFFGEFLLEWYERLLA